MALSLHQLADYFGAHGSPARDAHERDRARQRTAIALAFALVIGLNHLLGGPADPLDLPIAAASVAYGVLALGYLKFVLAKEGSRAWAQYAFLLCDPVMTVVVIVGTPQLLAAFYPILMVQIVRTGMRYGMRVMWLSWAAGALGAALLMPLSPFWMGEVQMLRSFVAMMLVVPVLFGPLIRTLHHVTDELRTAAGSDPLTGLGNRRMLGEHLRLAQQRSRRDATLLAVILFDLDHFKRVNDTLGHAAGDRLLAEVSAAIRNNCRAGDFLARVGGDEFVLLVEGLSRRSGRQQAHEIAQKIVVVIEASAEAVAPGAGVSASAGVHCWAYDDDVDVAEAELVASADRAMYCAKHGGKARVAMSAA